MRLRSLLAIAVMLLAACSDDDAVSTTGPPASTTTVAATTSTEAPETTTTTVPGPSGPSLNGTWIAEITHISVEGVCPSTPTQRGPVDFTVDGDQFTLVFPDEDFECDPLEACSFTGTIDGNVLTGANAGVADSEGGVYQTEFVATWDGADHIGGTGESTYTNEDFICTWDTSLMMYRE